MSEKQQFITPESVSGSMVDTNHRYGDRGQSASVDEVPPESTEYQTIPKRDAVIGVRGGGS